MRTAALALLFPLLACTPGPTNPDVSEPVGPPVPECRIDADGQLSADELPLQPGISVRYVRNEPGTTVSFPPDGAVGDAGARIWDFTEGPAEVGATLTTLDPAEHWFGPLFPDADLASPLLVESPELVGVYQYAPEEGELRLLGVTTATEQPPERKTLIIYDEPVVALRLPLTEGATWGQQATFRDAVIAGLPNAGVEDWHVEGDAAGAARLRGDVEVRQVLRVRSSVHRTLAVALGEPSTALHKIVWMAPCFGDIASLSGADATLQPADELRRYYP